MLAESHTEVR